MTTVVRPSVLGRGGWGSSEAIRRPVERPHSEYLSPEVSPSPRDAQTVRPALLSRGWKRVCPLVKRRDHHRCVVCGTAETFHTTPRGRRMPNLVVGHRTPPERYMGSHNDPSNLWTLCLSCNASQGNRTEEEWRAARSGRLVELGITGEPKTTATASAVVTTDYT